MKSSEPQWIWITKVDVADASSPVPVRGAAGQINAESAGSSLRVVAVGVTESNHRIPFFQAK